ncbi:MAG: hypothetical protein HYY84_05010 [Deltaproteobacteria bacterium]|nr:hypothetical protein [Deltaproteobacteria bacterium]
MFRRVNGQQAMDERRVAAFDELVVHCFVMARSLGFSRAKLFGRGLTLLHGLCLNACVKSNPLPAPPDTAFAVVPATLSNSAAASFSFFCLSATNCSYLCSLDNATETSCESPLQLTAIADGAHTFAVRAVSGAGVRDQTPASFTWTVDTTGPAVVFDGGPAALTNAASGTIAFAATEPASFSCTFDDGGAANCTSPFSFSGLADGQHTLAVRATDDAGNVGDASVYAWTADVTPPQSTVQSPASPVPYGSAIVVTGSASDSVSGVARVDVSTGGDAGWIAATGTTGWSASLFAAPRFFHRVWSRATDVVGNVELVDAGTDLQTSLFPAASVTGQSSFTQNCESLPTALTLNFPSGVLFVPASNRLFIADSVNHRVVAHQLSATNGFIDFEADVVLGRQTFTDCDSPVTTSTSMNNPKRLAFDPASNRLFVSDSTNNRVLVFGLASLTSGQPASTVIGQDTFDASFDGIGASRLNDPVGLAFDSISGRLFVVDSGNNRILVFNTNGLANGMNASNVLGQSTFTSSLAGFAADRLILPQDVAYDPVAARLFVADNQNHRVVVFGLDGGIVDGMPATWVLGQPTLDAGGSSIDPSATTMLFPEGLAFDPFLSRLYVADTGNNRVLVFNTGALTNGMPATNVLGQSFFDAGQGGTSASALEVPVGLALDSDGGRLFVADRDNSRVMVFDVTTITNGENAVHAFGYADVADAAAPLFDTRCANGPGPASVCSNDFIATAVDTSNRRLFVTNDTVNRVLVFRLDDAGLPESRAFAVLGQPDFSHCAPGLGASALNEPSGLAYDSASSRLFVADTGNNRVVIYNVSNVVTGQPAIAVLGQPNFDSRDTALSANSFYSPDSLVVDPIRSRLFVTDCDNKRVMVFDIAEIDAGGAAIAVLGQSDFTSNDAGVTQSRFTSACDIAMDPVSGRLFVADSDSNRVMVFETTTLTNGKAASYVLGQTNFTSGDESASSSGLNSPGGMVWDGVFQRLFVSDADNNRVVVYSGATLATGAAAINVIGQSGWGEGNAGLSSTFLSDPKGLAVDGTGTRLYVGDRGNRRVLTFDVGP